MILLLMMIVFVSMCVYCAIDIVMHGACGIVCVDVYVVVGDMIVVSCDMVGVVNNVVVVDVDALL